jgi:hypothetical protein
MAVAALFLLPLSAEATLITDTYSRSNSTTLGPTETGALNYEEFDAAGGNLNVADIARIESNRLRITGVSNNPSLVRLAGSAFNSHVEVEARYLASDYSPTGIGNNVLLVFRQGMDLPTALFSPKGRFGWISAPTERIASSPSPIQAPDLGRPRT